MNRIAATRKKNNKQRDLSMVILMHQLIGVTMTVATTRQRKDPDQNHLEREIEEEVEIPDNTGDLHSIG